MWEDEQLQQTAIRVLEEICLEEWTVAINRKITDSVTILVTQNPCFIELTLQAKNLDNKITGVFCSNWIQIDQYADFIDHKALDPAAWERTYESLIQGTPEYVQ